VTASGHSPQRVIYLLLTPVQDDSQDIYKAFANTTSTLVRCIKRDLEEDELLQVIVPRDDPESATDTAGDEQPPAAARPVKLVTTGRIQASSSKLYTAGFLLTLIKHLNDLNDPNPANLGPLALVNRREDLEIEPILFRTFYEEIVRLGLRHSCVIVLDEAPTTVDAVDANQTISFVRSLCRAAGLVAVLMGTDSTVANLISGSQQSRDEKKEELQIWSHVITALPSTKIDVLVKFKYQGAHPLDILASTPAHGPLYQCLQQHLPLCRPWLVILVFDALLSLRCKPEFIALSSLDLLQQLSASVLTAIKRTKRANVYWRQFPLAQLAMLSAAYTERQTALQLKDLDIDSRPTKETNVLTTAESVLVNHHLFQPLCSSSVAYINEDGLCDKDGQPWLAMSYLRAQEAPLLVVLMSCPSGAFETTRTQGRRLLSSFEKQKRNAVRTQLVFENSAALTVSGSWLEFLSSAILVRASHRGGLAGTPANTYVCNVLDEFSLSLAAGSAVDLQALCNNTTFRFPDIPFYLPPAADYETAARVFAPLIDAGFKLDHFDRTANKDEVDGLSTHVVLECKDYKDALDGDTLKAIIQRFANYPDRSLFFIVCNSIRAKYFARAIRSKTGTAATAATATAAVAAGAKRARHTLAAASHLPPMWLAFLEDPASARAREFVRETQFLAVRQSTEALMLTPLFHFQHLDSTAVSVKRVVIVLPLQLRRK
jgi:hypothetical protein